MIWLVKNSYSIVKIIFGVTLFLAALSRFIYGGIPSPMLYTFCNCLGVFVGYSFAFYSITFLQKHDMMNETET